MKRRIEFGIVIFSLMLVLSLSFVSAGFFSNILNKFTGEVSYGEPFLAEKVISSCVETDKGLDYDKLGVIVVGDKKREDFCLNVGPIKEVQTHINEYFCDKNGEISFEIYKCPNGCVGGVCVNVEEEIGVLLNQESSDFVYGKISFWYGKVNVHTENEVWVTDPDGTAGAGTFSQWGADGWFDRKLEYCQRFWPNTVEVQEAEKENISVWRNKRNVGGPFTTTKMTYFCKGFNSNINYSICDDFDGFGRDIFVQDKTLIGGEEYVDWCMDLDEEEYITHETNLKTNSLKQNSLLEYYCEAGLPAKEIVVCKLGCKNGACLRIIGEENEDLEAMEKLEVESEEELNGGLNKELEKRLEDKLDLKIVGEKLTFGKRVRNFFGGIFGKSDKVDQTDSIREGNESFCTDSDGGIDYYVEGNVLFSEGNNTLNYTDYCVRGNSTILKEYYCNETLKSLDYSCPINCDEGKCVDYVSTESNGSLSY